MIGLRHRMVTDLQAAAPAYVAGDHTSEDRRLACGRRADYGDGLWSGAMRGDSRPPWTAPGRTDRRTHTDRCGRGVMFSGCPSVSASRRASRKLSSTIS